MKKITPGIGSATQKTPVYQILCDSLNYSMVPVWARIVKRTVPVNRLRRNALVAFLKECRVGSEQIASGRRL